MFYSSLIETYYEKVANAFCSNQLHWKVTYHSPNTSLSRIEDAKAECQRFGNLCGGFFGQNGLFFLCAKPVIAQPTKLSALYRIDGTCIYFSKFGFLLFCCQ